MPPRVTPSRRAPRISVITPVCDPEEAAFREMLDSVRAQTYPHWELCLADDASTIGHVRRLIEKAAREDPRVKAVFRPNRGHISAASNTAIEMSSGDFLALVDHDDTIEPDALEKAAECIRSCSGVDMIYTDEDSIRPDGSIGAPYLKPAWSPDLFLSNMYTCHLGLYRRSLLQEIGGFRLGFEGSQDYDLVLRLTERARKICHLPEVLYHWRCSPTSTALDLNNKAYAFEAGRRALEEALARRGEPGTVRHVEGFPGHYRVRYSMNSTPEIAVFLGGADSGGALEMPCGPASLGGPITEIHCQDRNWTQNGLPDTETVMRAEAALLLFLHRRLVPLDDLWLKEMAAFAQRPEVGAVAGTWIDGGDTIVHAGLVLNPDTAWSLSHQGYPAGDIGYFGRLLDIANCAAVGSEGFMVEKEKFLAVNGFDETLGPARGPDLCLKLLRRGWFSVVLPHAHFRWTAAQPPSQPPASAERDLFVSKWQEWTASDPFSHPGLDRTDGLCQQPADPAFARQPRCTPF